MCSIGCTEMVLFGIHVHGLWNWEFLSMVHVCLKTRHFDAFKQRYLFYMYNKTARIQLLQQSAKPPWVEEFHQNGHEYSDMSRTTTTTISTNGWLGTFIHTKTVNLAEYAEVTFKFITKHDHNDRCTRILGGKLPTWHKWLMFINRNHFHYELPLWCNW